MATFTISLDSVCAGGDHATINILIDGGGSYSQTFSVTDILDNPSTAAVKAILLPILQLHLRGMTKLQARNAMQAGFTVTI